MTTTLVTFEVPQEVGGSEGPAGSRSHTPTSRPPTRSPVRTTKPQPRSPNRGPSRSVTPNLPQSGRSPNVHANGKGSGLTVPGAGPAATEPAAIPATPGGTSPTRSRVQTEVIAAGSPRKSREAHPIRHGRRFSGREAMKLAEGHPAGVLFGLGTAREVLRRRIHDLMAVVDTHRRAGETDSALTVLRKVEALHPGPPRVELGEVRAKLLVEGDRLEEAARILAWVLVNSKTGSDRHHVACRSFSGVTATLADRAADANDWAAALAGYNAATQQHPHLTPADFDMLWRCFRGKLQCLLALERYVEYFETAERVLGHSANLEALMTARFPVVGVQSLDCTFDLTAERAGLLLRERSRLHLTVSNLAGAVADVDAAARIHPHDPDTPELIKEVAQRLDAEVKAATAEYERGEYPSAIRRCRGLVAAQPMDFDMTTLLGQSLLKQGEPMAAAAAFVDAIDIALAMSREAEPIEGEGMPRPETPTQAARYRVAAAVFQVALRCSVTEATALLTEAIWLNSDDPEFFCARARCHAAVGNNAAAVNDFKDALYLEPSNFAAAVEMSSLLSERVIRAFDEGEVLQAAGILETAIDYNGESATLHTALAVIKSYLGDSAAALEHARIASDLEPSSTDAVATFTRLKLEGTVVSRFEPPGYSVPLPPIRTEKPSRQLPDVL
eukprot:m.205945 g.205945  ORF g.205945 m.205945 type:complete len:672 (+) comp15420_c2_seq3:2673-4688(+)